jgi:type VI secretion system Hcp family effector
MKKTVLTGLAAVALSLLASQNAHAQIETYMLVPGIPGEATARFHEDWIVVTSLTQSFDGTRAKSLCTAVVTKPLDKAGPLLWAAAVTGQIFNEIKIDILKNAREQLRFYELVLSNARISSITSAPSDLSEVVTFAGSSAKLSYYPQKADGTLDQPVTATAACR